MVKKKRVLALLLSCAITLTSIGLTGSSKTYAEVSATDFNVNSRWTMSGDITTNYKSTKSNKAYSTGQATIDDIKVKATFVKQADKIREHHIYQMTEIIKQPMEQQMICFMENQIQDLFQP